MIRAIVEFGVAPAPTPPAVRPPTIGRGGGALAPARPEVDRVEVALGGESEAFDEDRFGLGEPVHLAKRRRGDAVVRRGHAMEALLGGDPEACPRSARPPSMSPSRTSSCRPCPRLDDGRDRPRDIAPISMTRRPSSAASVLSRSSIGCRPGRSVPRPLRSVGAVARRRRSPGATPLRPRYSCGRDQVLRHLGQDRPFATGVAQPAPDRGRLGQGVDAGVVAGDDRQLDAVVVQQFCPISRLQVAGERTAWVNWAAACDATWRPIAWRPPVRSGAPPRDCRRHRRGEQGGQGKAIARRGGECGENCACREIQRPGRSRPGWPRGRPRAGRLAVAVGAQALAAGTPRPLARRRPAEQDGSRLADDRRGLEGPPRRGEAGGAAEHGSRTVGGIRAERRRSLRSRRTGCRRSAGGARPGRDPVAGELADRRHRQCLQRQPPNGATSSPGRPARPAAGAAADLVVAVGPHDERWVAGLGDRRSAATRVASSAQWTSSRRRARSCAAGPRPGGPSGCPLATRPEDQRGEGEVESSAMSTSGPSGLASTAGRTIREGVVPAGAASWEAAEERGLPDPRLTLDEHEPSAFRSGRCSKLPGEGAGGPTLEQTHAASP